MIPGKPQLRAKLEVASFSRCKNILGELQISGSSQGHAHFPSGCDFIMGFGKPKLRIKFEVAEILKSNPQRLGSYPSPGPHPFFLLVGFDD